MARWWPPRGKRPYGRRALPKQRPQRSPGWPCKTTQRCCMHITHGISNHTHNSFAAGLHFGTPSLGDRWCEAAPQTGCRTNLERHAPLSQSRNGLASARGRASIGFGHGMADTAPTRDWWAHAAGPNTAEPQLKRRSASAAALYHKAAQLKADSKKDTLGRPKREQRHLRLLHARGRLTAGQQVHRVNKHLSRSRVHYLVVIARWP